MVCCGICASVVLLDGKMRTLGNAINFFSFTGQLIKVDIRACVPNCFPLQNLAVFEFFSRLCLMWLLLMRTKELQLKLTVDLECLFKCFMKMCLVK